MINREVGLLEIYERLKEDRVALGLKAFRRNPTTPLEEEDLPAIFMSEGTDQITKHSGRTTVGYPAQRVLEVILEVVASKDVDIKQLFIDVRRTVFKIKGTDGSDPSHFSSVIATNLFFNENRTEGPTGYGLPDILGMSLVLDLVYTDKGF